MEGFVKSYLSEKGYGFITTKANEDFFFHITDVSQPEDVSQGVWMSFDPTEGKKGKAAKNIKIIHKKKFIKIGDKRIKLSNIKEYQKKKAAKALSFSREKLITQLYVIEIRTYQNDVFRFTGDESEVDSWLAELDKSI